jgi:c-di-GMP-binding flagellar brake protein YcgR
MRERRMIPRQTTDRRNFNRIHAKLDITTCLNDDKFNSYMQNLSSSGILIIDTPQNEIRSHQQCKIIFPVKDNKTIELDAQVIWIRNGLVGLSFVNMDRKIRSNLNQLILRLIKKTVAVDGMEVFG